MPRSRILYQTDALYVGPTGLNSVTGALQGGAAWGNISGSIASGQNLIAQLFRVQKCDNGWDKKLKILNQFGELGQVDLVPISPPDVSLSFSYVQANLVNENLMGFYVNKAGDTNVVSCLSGILSTQTNSKNYFIQTVAEGQDVDDNTPSEYDCVSFGNTFISSYTAQGRVLDFPTVDVSLVALNTQAQHLWAANTGNTAITPAIYPASGSNITGFGFLLPTGVTSWSNASLSNISGLSVLRPGDINLNLGLNAGDGFSLPQDMKIQSYSLSFNLGLEDLAQLGSKFFYAKLPKFPVEATLTVNALAGDFQTGSLVQIYNNNLSYNPTITLNAPGTNTPVVSYRLGNAKLESQKYGLSIGSNKTVDLSFRSTIGGPQDTVNGVFMSGICANI